MMVYLVTINFNGCLMKFATLRKDIADDVFISFELLNPEIEEIKLTGSCDKC